MSDYDYGFSGVDSVPNVEKIWKDKFTSFYVDTPEDIKMKMTRVDSETRRIERKNRDSYDISRFIVRRLDGYFGY